MAAQRVNAGGVGCLSRGSWDHTVDGECQLTPIGVDTDLLAVVQPAIE